MIFQTFDLERTWWSLF